jgi:NAD(P)-dependent dehydrogenase (short-subunit alcohol dehydrogenase family)
VGTIAITGSAGGIGAATRARLEHDGHRVIGVDLRDAEVIADLSTAAGREAMIEGVTSKSSGVLDGLVAGAGISSTGANEALVVSINYFGAVATLAGLRPLLARGTNPSAVAISSNSSTAQTAIPHAVVDACLAGDEVLACKLAEPAAILGYPAAKLALARWVRSNATGVDWIGAGIRLNGVAPGLVETPMTADGIDFVLSLGEVYPIPIGRAGRPEEVAGLLAFLLGPEAGFFVGSVVFMDGGTDAALRAADWPVAR